MSEKRKQWELLTESEKQFLLPIEKIISDISAKYRYVDEEAANSKIISDKQNEEFRSMCAAMEIDTKRAAAISTKLFTSPWYCYYISNVDTTNGEWINVFSLCTSQHPDPITINPTTNPDFYKAAWSTSTDPDAAYPAILDSLHLQRNFKFIYVEDYEALATIAEVYTDQDNGVIIKRMGGRRIKSVDIPLDKPNSKIWNMLAVTTGSQIAFSTKRAGTKKEVSVLYSIDFDELTDAKITKTLDPFDKRVYVAVAALFNAGNTSMSVSQIYNVYYDGVPGKSDREKINNSITKMAAARILIDNAQEVNAGYKYPRVQYEGYLLPMERVNVIINGDLVESAIHPFREPPMISFARGRKQITTVERKVLATPVNKTNTNLAIEDYLLNRITKARAGNGQRRILYSTLFEEAHLTTSKQQQRAKKTIEKILTHYVSCDVIKRYTTDAEGISFSFSGKRIAEKR